MLADNRDLHRRANAYGTAKAWSLPLFTLFLTGLFIVPARADIPLRGGGSVPGTSGIDVGPFIDLSFFDLTNADFTNADLFSANLNNATLTSADMTGANLISANLSAATFNNASLTAAAIFTNAHVASANFSFGTSQRLDFDAMFAQTKSYAVKDLIGVGIGSNDFSGKNLANQNLGAANLSLGTYGLFFDTNLGTYTISTDFTRSNLASVTAQVSNFSNLDQGSPTFTGATFHEANLATANFSNGTFDAADLTSANLSFATLSSARFGTIGFNNGTSIIVVPGAPISNAADFSGATVNFANLSSTVSGTISDKGFRKELLYDTISYQNHDLRGINLSSNDLTVGGGVSQTGTILTAGGGTWDFSSQNLTGANFSNSTLAINVTNLVTQSTATFITRRTAAHNALFTGANLSSVNFSGAALAGTNSLSASTAIVDFTDATINFANFSSTATSTKWFRHDQLYSTASYKNNDLRGVNLSSNDLTKSGTANIGWSFSGQDLGSANFSSATLSTTIGTSTYSADFTDAIVNFTNFSSTTQRGFKPAQLYSTASYDNLDLRGINLSSNDLTVTGSPGTAWDLSNQNLSFANLSSATLGAVVSLTPTTVSFSGATVTFANFSSTTSRGLTFSMLQETTNYQQLNFDFRGVNLSQNTMTGTGQWDFSNFNLAGASFTSSNLSAATFSSATLTTANLTSANLTGALFDFAAMDSANLTGATLTSADFTYATLTLANLSGARLYSANFGSANLNGVNFNGATFSSGTSAIDGANLAHAFIKGATFSFATLRGFSDQMLYATDSYQVDQDLTGANFSSNNMAGWIFGDSSPHNHMDLSSVSFASGTLSGAQFTHATIAFANFSQTTGVHGLIEAQLQDTNSWVNHDLRGINLSFNDLNDWDLSGQNLASANFSNSTLSILNVGTADFTGANIRGANFSVTTGKGFTKEQLYSTQSYVDQDLSGINLSFNSLAPVNPSNQSPLPAWDLHGQNLQGASFNSSVLSNSGGSVNFTDANIKDASFDSTTATGFTFAQLQSTKTYADHDLGAIGMGSNNLTGWDLSNQNLNKANFAIATLDTTNFAGARIAGANFSHTTPFGFTQSQLESTFSWPNHTLGSINLSQNNLAGWDFSSQLMAKSNFSLSLLTEANFNDALLHDANFTSAGLIATTFNRADLRGAKGFTGATLSLANTILPDGTIQGLHLNGGTINGTTLIVRDYNGSSPVPIHVTGGMTLTNSSNLVVRLHDGSWGSTISFDPGIPITLDGTLDLGIDDTANLPDIYNYPGHLRPIQLFDWNTPPGSTFAAIVKDSHFSWDTSDLYAGGTILVNGLYGDLNRDGRVDVADLLILAQHWQQPALLWSQGNMTDVGASNGVVDIADLILLTNNWRYGIVDPATTTGPNAALAPILTSLNLPVPASVPEPVLVGPLMMLGAMAMLRRSRKPSTEPLV